MSDRKQPDIYHTITPYLTVKDARVAAAFYGDVFKAQPCINLEMPGGGVAHIEIKIGDTRFMIGEEYPDMDIKSPATLGGSPLTLVLYVDDVDAVTADAAARGATVLAEPEDQFHGDRTARIRDPFGHIWMLATMLEDVDDVEVVKRFNKMVSGGES
ncbi:MAG: VOC family protein [Alphaproteobacteria bacterium]